MSEIEGPELARLRARFEEVRRAGGEMHFTLGDDPGSLEDMARIANAMLDYAAESPPNR